MARFALICPNESSFYNFRREFIEELNALGNEIYLICPYGTKIDWFTDRGCNFIDLDIDRRGTSILNDTKLLYGYFKILKKIKPKVVLLYTTKCSVYGGIVCRVLKIPYIVNNAGLIQSDKALHKKFLDVLYRLGFSKASCMMYQNTYERDYLNSLLKNKVHYRDIPGSGVNLDEFKFSEYPNQDEIVVFNYVARIVKIKGIEEYLDCAERIKEEYPNTEFRIFGSYDDEEYKSRIGDLEQKGIVKYYGNQLDMKPFIKEAHAVIHPSYYEGMTNVVLEHSAMGRVCIGSNIPGIREAIDDEYTGFVFEMKNINSLIEAVRKFINLSYDKKREMGKHAHEKMEKLFDRKIVSSTYLTEINKAL